MGDDTTKENFERALADYQNATRQISDLIKYIGFGLLAVFYTTRADIDALPPENWLRYVHLAAGLSAALIILTDYLHYFFATRASYDAVLNKTHQFQYDTKSICYRLRSRFYFLKQAMTAIGSSLVVTLILYL